MRAKRFLAGTIAGVTTLTLIGGCAAQQIQALEPKLELRNAAQQLADADQAGFTLKLSGDPADLLAAVKLQAQRDKSADDDAPSAEDLRMLFNSSVTMAYDKGGPGADDDKSSLAATVDGVAGTELRFVGGSLYAKVPVARLAAKFGATPAEVKSLSAEAVGEMPGLDALFAGKWVSVDSKELTGSAAAGKEPEQEKALKELTASATNLLEGAEVVRDSADDKHLIVTTSTAKAYAEAQRFAGAVDKSLAGKFTDAPTDKPVVLDLWIDNGKLTAAEINVLQFIDGATGRVAARLELTTGAPIATPTGATKLEVGGLLGGMPALNGLSATN